jgi:hypothetical protein
MDDTHFLRRRGASFWMDLSSSKREKPVNPGARNANIVFQSTNFGSCAIASTDLTGAHTRTAVIQRRTQMDYKWADHLFQTLKSNRFFVVVKSLKSEQNSR